MQKSSFRMILPAVVIIIIIVGFFFFKTDRNESNGPSGASEVVYLDEGESMEVVPAKFADAVLVSEMAMAEGSLTGPLFDITSGFPAGTAYLVRDGSLYHYAVAELPEPGEGNVYEGWLVSQNPTLQFFSTGVMQLNEDGMYTLAFMANEEYSGYDMVVITEETVVDATPEAHILEGMVQ